MSDDTIEGELTVDDIIAEAEGASEGKPYNPLIKIWDAVLQPAVAGRGESPTPQWCNKMITQYPGLEYKDMRRFRDDFFDKIEAMHRIVREVVDEDPEALNVIDMEEDRTLNHTHYKRVLTDWQRTVLLWELEWDCEDPKAAIQIGTISEIHRMFIAEQGLVTMLDQISFEFTEADQAELAEDLESLKESIDG